MTSFDVVDLIRTKRDGGTLTDEEIRWLIRSYTDGGVGDEQMSAMAMAIFFRGLDGRELPTWMQAMIDTGVRMDFSSLSRRTADKHSTGGVGDKITLPLAPLVAACGVAVPQLSGRGLGHTGGTLDKLEAIPGWRADLTNDEMLAQLEDVGAVICAAGAGLAPADKKLYALRDVTGTVESIAMISASIMSKKIAEGTGSLVLDVKTGAGAFMKKREDSDALARTMVALGKAAGVNTVALVTDMNAPLGRSAGNGVEVAESVEVLAGGGPSDVVDLTLALAREMLACAGVDADPAAALASGKAMDVWRRMISAQGGDPAAPLPTAKYTEVVRAASDGWISSMDAMAVGLAAWRLGAGRARKEDPVQAAAGVTWTASVGERVTAGQELFVLHTDDADRLPRGLESLADAVTISAEPVERGPIVLGRID